MEVGRSNWLCVYFYYHYCVSKHHRHAKATDLSYCCNSVPTSIPPQTQAPSSSPMPTTSSGPAPTEESGRTTSVAPKRPDTTHSPVRNRRAYRNASHHLGTYRNASHHWISNYGTNKAWYNSFPDTCRCFNTACQVSKFEHDIVWSDHFIRKFLEIV